MQSQSNQDRLRMYSSLLTDPNLYDYGVYTTAPDSHQIQSRIQRKNDDRNTELCPRKYQQTPCQIYLWQIMLYQEIIQLLQSSTHDQVNLD
jgi:hypothetical protein